MAPVTTKTRSGQLKLSAAAVRNLKVGINGVFRHISEKDGIPFDSAKLKIMQQYKDQGLSPVRFRWDMLWAAQGRVVDSLPKHYLCDLYDAEGVNDNHIDSALRAIMREHGMDWAASSPIRR